MILADTSVWIDHLRAPNPGMVKLLDLGQIVMHPFIVAEIALGSLKNRRAVFEDMESLLEVQVAQLSEVRRMIEVRSLYSRGIGLTDAHLLASTLITPSTSLWTLDTRLRTIAAELGIGVSH